MFTYWYCYEDFGIATDNSGVVFNNQGAWRGLSSVRHILGGKICQRGNVCSSAVCERVGYPGGRRVMYILVEGCR